MPAGPPVGDLPNQENKKENPMKLKPLFTLLAACAIVVPAFAEEDTPLAKEMEKISKALKSINRNLADVAQKDANVAKVAEAQAANVAATKLEPAKTKDVPAAERAKFLAAYKTSMENAGKSLDALKAAIEGGKTDDAKTILDKLNGQKKEGHKEFKAED